MSPKYNLQRSERSDWIRKIEYDADANIDMFLKKTACLNGGWVPHQQKARTQNCQLINFLPAMTKR